MKRAICLAGLIAAVLSAPADAASKQFRENDPVQVEPGRAYLLLRADSRDDVQIVRIADEAQRRDWKAKETKTFEKAKAGYAKALATYQEDLKLWNSGDPTARQFGKPEMPEPVTAANFSFPPAEIANFVTVAGGRTFTKAEGSYSYFVEIDPGTYVIYRRGAVSPCLCMGSISFDALAGKIVDLGELRRDASQWLTPADPTMRRPPQLAGQTIEPATRHAAGKMPNFFGTLIDRAPAIPGVLAYDRDVPLDVASGNKPVDSIR